MTLTETDRAIYAAVPMGRWFTWDELPGHVRRRRYRCERLVTAGWLQRRINPKYKNMPGTRFLDYIWADDYNQYATWTGHPAETDN